MTLQVCEFTNELCTCGLMCAVSIGDTPIPPSSLDGCPKAPAGEVVHCQHWWDCEPCCWCGFDGGGDDCDCPRHQAQPSDEGSTDA